MDESTRSVSFDFLHLPGEAFGHDDGSSRRHARFEFNSPDYESVGSALLEAIFLHPEALSAEERSCVFRGAVVVELLTDDHNATDLTDQTNRSEIGYVLDEVGVVSCVDRDDVWTTSLADIKRAIDDGTYPRTTRLQFFVGVPGGWGDSGSAGGDPWVTFAAASLNIATEQLVDMALGVALAATFGRGRALVERKRMRDQAAFWRHKGFVTSGDLHEYIDRKQPWKAATLANRISVSTQDAEHLMKTIGYEQAADGRWSAGVSKQARSRRHKWLGKISWEPIVSARK